MTRAIAILAVLSAGSLVFSGRVDSGDDINTSLHRLASSNLTLSSEQIQRILSDRLAAAPRPQISKLARHLLKLCQKYRFDPAFILSLIEVESGFKVTALSPAGAVGLMQLMPATANGVVRDMRPPLDARTKTQVLSQQLLMDPFVNLTLGVAYLAFLRDRYQGFHPYFLLAAYNMGPTKIDELRSRKGFKPDKTKKYFEAIRQGVHRFRSYHRPV